MKKILTTLFLLSFLAALVAPLIASAKEAPTECTLKYNLDYINPACKIGGRVSIAEYGACCIVNTLYKIADYIFIVLMALSVIFAILGALQLIMAGGDPLKVEKGRNYVTYALIGVIVAILAKTIPSVARMIAT